MKFQNTRTPKGLQKRRKSHICDLKSKLHQISQKKDNRALALHNSEEK